MFRSAVLLAAVLILSPVATVTALAQSPAVAPTTALAESTLKKTITDIQAGKPDYANMAPELAEAIRTQPALMEQLKALGAPTAFTRAGTGENPWQYDVAFAAGATLTWTISLAADGKIAGLFVMVKG